MRKDPNDDILKSLADGYYYSRDDLLKIIQSKRPAYLESSCRWVLSSLLKNTTLVRIARGSYIKMAALQVYEPDSVPESLSEGLSLLKKTFPDAKMVAFDSSILNEWLNKLIAHSTSVIEIDPAYLEDAYYALKAKSKATILLKPTEKEMTHYHGEQTILLEPLRSRSPLNRQGTSLRLEKLMVDLLSDDFFAYFCSKSELPDIYEEITKKYAIDRDTLFAYAKRRQVYDELMPLIPEELKAKRPSSSDKH
jgi:hypothetical protein